MGRWMNRLVRGEGMTPLFIVRLALLAAGVIALAVVVSVIASSGGGWPSIRGGDQAGPSLTNGGDVSKGDVSKGDVSKGDVSKGNVSRGERSDGDVSDGDVSDGAVPRKPLEGVHVVLDPGHGGPDRGACHFPSALIEKEINLDMALRLERVLQEAGAATTLTRRDDTFLSLDERAELANERGADLFISLHVNRFPSSDCFGAQTFYLPSSEEGRRLAMLIQEELLTVYPPNYRQALPGDYRVLRGSHMPAALVEIGFVTSPVDRELMAQADYRERVAAAIVEACVRFVRGDSPAPATSTDPSIPDGTMHGSIQVPVHVYADPTTSPMVSSFSPFTS